MEKFILGENGKESVLEELVRRTGAFIEDSKKMLGLGFVDINLINKILETVASYKETLMQITPKNNDEDVKIKSVLQDLIDLETICNQRKTLH